MHNSYVIARIEATKQSRMLVVALDCRVGLCPPRNDEDIKRKRK